MSRPTEQEDGALGVHGTQGAPMVYQPRGEVVPAYEEYADPATAHGWQNAYDETAELPRTEPAAPEPAVSGSAAPVPTGRADRRRAAARRARGAGSRRLAVAAGAVGAVSVAALIGGLSFSGSSEPAPHRSGTAGVTDPASSAAPASPDGTASAGPASGTSASAPAPTDSAPDDPKASAGSAAPTATSSGAPSSATPTASASGGTGPGNSVGKGRGQGNTKAPK